MISLANEDGFLFISGNVNGFGRDSFIVVVLGHVTVNGSHDVIDENPREKSHAVVFFLI